MIYVLAIILVVLGCVNLYLMFKPKKYDGAIVITTQENGKRLFSLEINRDPEELEKMTAVLFKVVDTYFEDLD